MFKGPEDDNAIGWASFFFQSKTKRLKGNDLLNLYSTVSESKWRCGIFGFGVDCECRWEMGVRRTSFIFFTLGITTPSDRWQCKLSTRMYALYCLHSSWFYNRLYWFIGNWGKSGEYTSIVIRWWPLRTLSSPPLCQKEWTKYCNPHQPERSMSQTMAQQSWKQSS